MNTQVLLHSGFLQSSERYPERLALEVENSRLTYAELRSSATSLAATLNRHASAKGVPLTAVFAYRSPTAFAGVLAALLRGHGYVPLNRTFPPERTKMMLERADCAAVVVDAASAQQLPTILSGFTRPLTLLLPDVEDASSLRASFPQHIVLGRSDVVTDGEFAARSASPADIAYLLFTSGSTGVPKGVMVSHRNATHYVQAMTERYQLSGTDRCSQTFDPTFDLSVHDMFLTWERGACLCCPSQKTLLKPGRFIRDARLTVWFSVPSMALFMKRFGELRPDLYPNLRLSLFCGEALPVTLVEEWAKAAPNSIIENIYGPTELTIACTGYRWELARARAEAEAGLVPIGEPIGGMNALIVDENLNEVALGVAGELVVSGPQVALGYLSDPEKTAKVFVVPFGRTEIHYRTGDRVRRSAKGGPLVYLGRVDNQIKVLGHRVELGEIEAALREETGVDAVVAVGWPQTRSGAGGVEAFVQIDRLDTSALQERLRSRLPVYMLPRRFHLLRQFPLNVNGKVDRESLLKVLQTSV